MRLRQGGATSHDGGAPVIGAAAPPPWPPRLLAGVTTPHGAARLDRVAHLTVHGTAPVLSAGELVALAENIGLRGRGGAGFPFARKVTAVREALRRSGGPAAVVVNGTEGEPGCLKDTALLLHAPHLVLDGALLAAHALGAQEVAVGVTRADVADSVGRALAERGPMSLRSRVARLPERFVGGEGSALVDGLDGGPGLPSGRKVRSSERGLGGLPTLLSNTETYAQLAVAARLGALGHRATGVPDEPGTLLLTVAGRHVLEAPTGAPLAQVLAHCGTGPGQGVLIGGYHGTFLAPAAARTVTLDRAALAAHGAVLGAGALLPLPAGTCPAGECAAVARWLAGESAGQCGPCVLGLPALADALAAVVRGGGARALAAVRTRARAVERRGACGHPDGTARFVASALAAFPEEFAAHAHGGGCGRPVLGALPLPVGAAPPAAASPVRAAAPAAQLVVDWTLCRGHGLCADLAPGVVRLGPDGYPQQAAMALPARMRRRAQLAVRRCPALALRVRPAAE
ncbi:NADH-ubiquinone oxidoreductase-F iron-sulfur binding region domain-containing protein [Streptomyces niger]|uniref:NADH-ubiquinone oxidoreductase-F iron-sulfur binding region domain-containing protein n=1 Tax=Streptomyces niger TaxID=66373 RepID=UPI000ADE6AB8|nr:NADH-ubiquinone oxidoreductase-F iron-sulfur binding region domain-containing protein [Streptomyces niger]